MANQSLEEWLSDMRESENGPDWRMWDSDEDEDEDGEGGESRPQRVVWRFPSNEALNQFVANIDSRGDEEVDMVLRNLLVREAATGADSMRFELYLQLRDSADPEENRHAEKMKESLHFRRVLAYYSGAVEDLPWEGLQWVRQLLPKSPATALSVLDAYFLANMWEMTDSRVDSLSDAEAVIRARYIGLPPATQAGRRALLYDISPRQFERLAAVLYEAMGYRCELTPATRDGGRDVIARRDGPGSREHILIECKRYADTVGAAPARTLFGVVQRDRATSGKVLTTSDFSPEARAEFAGIHSIELVGGIELVGLMNEHLGSDWPARLDRIISERNKLRCELENYSGRGAGSMPGS